MLLSQQAQLLAVRQGFPLLADVLVVADWLPTVHSRRRLIEAALLQAWGEPVALQLEVSW
jgi:hypothetical protein